jgi:multidrug efflux pump subunit AcrA (membrane-fusion protein)
MPSRQRIFGVSLAGLAVLGAAGALAVVARSGDAAYAGVISPATVSALQVTAPGRIVQVLVQPGQRVRAGQLLARQDATVAEAVVAADRADLAASQARLAALQATPASSAVGGRLALLAGKAAQQVTFAEQDAAATAQLLAADRERASALLAELQQKQAGDLAAQAQACAVTPTPTPAPAADVARCAVLAGQVGQDGIEVTRQQDLLAQAAAQQQLSATEAAHAIAAAQVGAQLAQAEQGLVPVGSPADIAAAGADLARAQTVLGRDEAALAALRIVAPNDGTVLGVGAVPGELAEPAGVRQEPAALSGPQAVTSAVPITAGTPGAAAAPIYQPLITLQTGTALHVTVQISEGDLAKFNPGRHATASVNVAGASHIPLLLIGLQPVSTAGKVSFAAVFTTPGQPPVGITPGLTANVVLS